jgi:prolipoprotein diacylglyceryltransferase
MNDPRHPIWGVAKGLVAVLVLFVILWFSSSRFDNTELETVGWFAAIYAIMQGSHEFFKRGKSDV